MNNTGITLVLTVVLLLAIIGGAAYFFLPRPVPVAEPDVPAACTEEAKICPDGSAVGRTGPACAFAECPTVEAKEPATAGLNQKLFTNGIFITPLEVTADSRCPSDVTCVSAGDISVKVKLEKGTTTADVTLNLQSAVMFEGYALTLTEVTPTNISTTTLAKSDYRFTFSVTALATPSLGTISGRVTTSPTCPIERIPAEPQCSPKPYATTIQIREEGKQAIIKTIASNNLGVFTTDLAIGTYTLTALTVDNAALPRCAPVTVTIKSGQTTVQDISCDTGIR